MATEGPEDWQRGGFGLYVHWPFCEAKCPYCDFNSHVVSQVDQARWARALASEVRCAGEQTQGRVLSSIFFGGGTPSLMAPETVAAVIEAARDSWTFANDIEVTLEANPRSVEAGRFVGYARAGVNRVSLGVQSLRGADLRRLGRLHDVDEARKALSVARDCFDRVSFDLIYARQDQSLQDWREELEEALELAVDHLSLYQLTVEEGTAFWNRARAGGLRGLPGEDLAADMYELTQEICSAAGYDAYEVSNHARPGAQSRHNLVYWRYGDWVGVGPGAHGRISQGPVREATVAWRMPGAWIAQAEAGSGMESREILSAEDQASEYLMMGLRLSEGLYLDRLHALDPAIAPESKIAELSALGLIESRDGVLRTTGAGRLVLNSVIAALLP
ncbi:radical SAM family heme chaperone HemW [Maliponia aquimaris]|uniref:Heme chaperone HemW n=1 Tax=Maliponia aquimaris TaxID=1673631 RepID=A0A238JNU5_9RHOB|nr:radical SAM family heme chaperone HemW [Maliponia aquimaris]SMX32349.1 Oxygen-independent coproporphyrinogen-III oxidase 1 [Maliponia aquimaris]